MPKTKKRDHRLMHADQRRRTNVPMPPIEEIQQELMRQLTPATFAQARRGHSPLNLRDRILNLPAMCAIVISIVMRQISSLGEVVRMLAEEQLLWLEATKVSVSALSKRFEKLPASLFANVFEQMVAAQTLRRREAAKAAEQSPSTTVHRFAALEKLYGVIWIADATTLERLRKATTALRATVATALGGKLLVIVDAIRHLPITAFFDPKAQANERRFNDRILAAIPVGGLMIVDAGFFSFSFFDAFTLGKKFFLTRMKSNTVFEHVELLSKGSYFRDEIIKVGLNASHPCVYPLRMVSVFWGKTWYRYLTNELDPTRLSAEQIATLYRSRWRIEEAFLLTKRLLGMAHIWVNNPNGVEMQIYATLMFYSVLIELCQDLARALEQPLERISVEMVFRSLYHFSQKLTRDPEAQLIPYFCERAKSFGLIKAVRKRHREREAEHLIVWASP